jgi:hypothetical protein
LGGLTKESTMKKKPLRVLKLAKKSISNLSSQKIVGRIAAAYSEYGGATCLVCPTYDGGVGCPSFDCDIQQR